MTKQNIISILIGAIIIVFLASVSAKLDAIANSTDYINKATYEMLDNSNTFNCYQFYKVGKNDTEGYYSCLYN